MGEQIPFQKPDSDDINIKPEDTKTAAASKPNGKPFGNRFLITYSLALFSVAAFFILISYLFSVRMSEQNMEQAQNTQQLSLTALQTVDTMRQDIAGLTEQLQEQENANQRLTEAVEDLEARLELQRFESMRQLETSEQNAAALAAELEDALRLHNALELLRLAQQNSGRGGDSDKAREYLEMIKPDAALLPETSAAEGEMSPAGLYEQLCGEFDVE